MMYRIGVFSKLCKTTIKTLRYYDEMGLLIPDYIDSENGYRYYSTKQLLEFHKIVSLRQFGLSIDEIIAIIDGHNIEGILKQRKLEIEIQLRESNDQLSRINHYLIEMKEGLKMNYNAVLKELPECIVFSKKMVAPNYDSYFSLIPAIGEEVTRANPTLKCMEPGYSFIIYHDWEYKESNINIEYCEAVEKFGTETDNIKFKKISKVNAVCVIHKGSYSTLGQVYAYTFKWIEDNGYTVIESPREQYIDGIWNTENEEEWLTELQVPVIRDNI